MTGGGVITVSCFDHAQHVVFRIHNTGSFIPKEFRRDIFKGGFTQGKAHGTGHGLAIVASLVAAQQGDITITSSVEHGTAFEVALPKAQQLDRPLDTRLDRQLNKQNSWDSMGGVVGVIVVIDDDAFVGEAWEKEVPGARYFASAERFYKSPLVSGILSTTVPETDVPDRPPIVAFMLDYHLADGHLGTDLALRLQRDFPGVPCFITSDLSANSVETELVFLPKNPKQCYQRLLSHM